MHIHEILSPFIPLLCRDDPCPSLRRVRGKVGVAGHKGALQSALCTSQSLPDSAQPSRGALTVTPPSLMYLPGRRPMAPSSSIHVESEQPVKKDTLRILRSSHPTPLICLLRSRMHS